MSNLTPGAPLDQILLLVERAIRGDRQLLVQLFHTFQRLAYLPQAPPEGRQLGMILSRLLMGDRQPDLSGLPPDMVDEIQDFLSRLA